MANAIDFAGSNRKLLPPQGAENVEALHTYTNGMCSVSCWELTQDEIAEILRTGRVFLTVLSGTTQPPVFVGSEDIMRSFVVDYGGVWARGKGDLSE